MNETTNTLTNVNKMLGGETKVSFYWCLYTALFMHLIHFNSIFDQFIANRSISAKCYESFGVFPVFASAVFIAFLFLLHSFPVNRH